MVFLYPNDELTLLSLCGLKGTFYKQLSTEKVLIALREFSSVHSKHQLNPKIAHNVYSYADKISNTIKLFFKFKIMR